MSAFARARKRVLERVITGLNRADEIGGEIRDFITERVLEDERYIELRKRIAAIRGNDYVSQPQRRAAETARAAEAARAAPPPAADVEAGDRPLGDPELAAQIYGKSSCPWTGRAVRLLEDLKVDYDYFDFDENDDDALAGALIAETKQHTVPYIFVRGQFVGGFNAVDELHRVGKLEYLLMTPKEREKANPALARVAITPRPNSDEVAPAE